MRTSFSTALALAAAALPTAFAHYNFESLIVNGNVTGPYEYVRKTTNANSPIEDPTSKNIICNAGGLDADIRAGTKTHTVAPGDEVGFKVNSELGHPGPLAVYMSRAPDGTEASDYLGDGDWFKVYSMTTKEVTEEGLQWANYMGNGQNGISNFTFTLPEDLPAGTYLMRGEHIGLHGAGQKNGAQYYIGCAQLTVEGNGAGKPSPVVSFPGAYTGEEPGLLLSLYWPPVTNYTAPGPAVWPGKCEDHTPNFVGQTSDGDCTNDKPAAGGSDDAVPPVVPSAVPEAPGSPVETPVAGTPVAGTPVAEVPAPVFTAPINGTAATPAPVPSAGGSKSCAARRRRAKRAARGLKF
ncbi:hypothetical protein F66182_4925 [Fusarium sp. NRRL 66182]|nr:hypothetical protein F66182_4925 [Fusarium sp. NRRL 66182]